MKETENEQLKQELIELGAEWAEAMVAKVNPIFTYHFSLISYHLLRKNSYLDLVTITGKLLSV